MKKRLGIAIATLGTALTLLTPATAMAHDRDDWGYRGRGWDRHERHERHEREERWERRHRRYGGYYGGGYYYSSPSYGYGYGYQAPYNDGYGYYNQAPPQGYYDRWGYYHPY